MQTDRVTATLKPHQSRSLKAKHAKAMAVEGTKYVSLKHFLRAQKDNEVVHQVGDWFHNKRCNTSKPQLGIGRTNGKSKKGKSGK